LLSGHHLWAWLVMEDAAQTFMSVTGAGKEVAMAYLKKSHGNVDAAVASFFEEESGDGVQSDSDMVDESSVHESSSGAGEAVDSILGTAKETTQQKDEQSKWGGGVRLGGAQGVTHDSASASSAQESTNGAVPKKVRQVRICFFSDGFTVDENDESEKEEAEPAAAQPKAAPRRTGLASLSDYTASRAPGAKMPEMPKIPPLRRYNTKENEAFLQDLKQGVVPPELRKRDGQTGEPIGVSIAVIDQRPDPYPQELVDLQKKLESKMQKLAKDEPPAPNKVNLFAGAGQTLSSAPAACTDANTASASASSHSHPVGNEADPDLLSLVRSRSSPQVDESKPATNIQLRLASGFRVKARLNLQHTVGDLWRFVADTMGIDAFASASGHELVAGFPPKPISNPDLTLASADLANAAVTHRCNK